MEETPSSMVSSEAESEGSVILEQRAHDGEAPMPFSSDASVSDAHASQDRSAPTLTANDWRNVGNSLASIISTRGINLLPINLLTGVLVPSLLLRMTGIAIFSKKSVTIVV